MNKTLSKALHWPQTPLCPFLAGFLTEIHFSSCFAHTANISQSNHLHIALVIRTHLNSVLWLFMSSCVFYTRVSNVFPPSSKCTSTSVSAHKGIIQCCKEETHICMHVFDCVSISDFMSAMLPLPLQRLEQQSHAEGDCNWTDHG